MANNLNFLVKETTKLPQTPTPTPDSDIELKKLEKKNNFLNNVKKASKKIKKAEIPVVPGNVVAKPATVKSPRCKWNNSFSLKQIEMPVLLSGPGKKRFSIRIIYLDDAGKKKTKTVRFGDRTVSEYIDHNDLLKKKSVQSRLQNVNDPFHKSFWRLNLLNNKENIIDSYTDLMQQLNLFKI